LCLHILNSEYITKNTSDIFSQLTALVPWIHSSSRMYILVTSSIMTSCKNNYYPAKQTGQFNHIRLQAIANSNCENFTAPSPYFTP